MLFFQISHTYHYVFKQLTPAMGNSVLLMPLASPRILPVRVVLHSVCHAWKGTHQHKVKVKSSVTRTTCGATNLVAKVRVSIATS